MKNVDKPEYVKYISANGELGYPVSVVNDNGEKETKYLRWHKGEIKLHIHDDAKLIKEMDRLIENQYARDADGNLVKDTHGNNVVKGDRLAIPFVKFDMYEESLLKTPVKVPIGRKTIEASSDEVIEGLKLLRAKQKKEEEKAKVLEEQTETTN